MQRLTFPLALVVAAIGAVTFWNKFEISGLDSISVRQRPREASSTGGGDVLSARDRGMVRIASFNIQAFGETKLSKPAVTEILVDIVRRFDVVAVQEIRARHQDVLPRFIELINAAGAHYDYVIGPRVGRTSSTEQYAYLFNRETIEVDRTAVYSVDDPDDLLHREPLVAAFRVRGPPPEQAFTFSLINIHTDPDEATAEVNVLDDVYLAVLRDGRNEDDIILLGDLNVDEQHLGDLARMPHLVSTPKGMPTNTRGTRQFDHLIFSEATTREYTGQAGVLDLVREYNLSVAEALAVSDHCPVWAEFNSYETSQPEAVAERPRSESR